MLCNSVPNSMHETSPTQLKQPEGVLLCISMTGEDRGECTILLLGTLQQTAQAQPQQAVEQQDNLGNESPYSMHCKVTDEPVCTCTSWPFTTSFVAPKWSTATDGDKSAQVVWAAGLMPSDGVDAGHLSCVASRSTHPFQNGFAARGQIQHWPLLPCGVAGVSARSQCFGASPARHRVKARQAPIEAAIALYCSTVRSLQDWCYVSVSQLLTYRLVSCRYDFSMKPGAAPQVSHVWQPADAIHALQQMLEQYRCNRLCKPQSHAVCFQIGRCPPALQAATWNQSLTVLYLATNYACRQRS